MSTQSRITFADGKTRTVPADFDLHALTAAIETGDTATRFTMRRPAPNRRGGVINFTTNDVVAIETYDTDTAATAA